MTTTRFPRARTLVLLGLFVAFCSVALLGQSPRHKKAPHSTAAHSFAQQLVQKTLSRHADTDEIGISVSSGSRCTVVASTDKSDVGEACEEDDSAPLRTGRPSVGKEGGEFDVSVPLHDRTGASVGALTDRFKRAAGQTNASVTDAAMAIAKEVAGQIPSKAALVGR
jgi:hypothetical protein